MKATLLLCAGLLTLIGAMPASAMPVFDAAQLVSQAAINPIYMNYEGIKGSVTAMEETARLIGEVEKPSEGLTKIGQGDVILARAIKEAEKENALTDAAGTELVDLDGFAKSMARSLNNKHPELVKFAAVGWDMSEKRAKAKIAGLLKNPTWDDTDAAIIAILVGMLKAAETETAAMDSRAGVGILKSQDAAHKGWIELESVSLS